MDTFQVYGSQFQVKLVTSLLFDKPFLQQIYDILRPQYFEQKSTEWIVKHILSYYNQYKCAPTLDVFKVEVQEIKSDIVLHETVIQTLKEVIRFKKSSDLLFVKEQALEFCKNQIVKLAILESVDLLKEGSYGEIKKKIDDALKAGSERDSGHVWKRDIEDRYKPESRNPIPTPWTQMTELMQGGLGGGELGVVVAPSGAGKSWILCALGAHALRQGHNVLHFTLELGGDVVGLRYDSIFTGIPNNIIRQHKDSVEQAIQSIGGELQIKRYPGHRVTVIDLSNFIDLQIANGFKPDMVIIDYGDLLLPVSYRKKSVDRRFELEEIYTDLRSLGFDYNVPVWNASQTNRSGMNLDEIEADSVGEAYQKIQVGDFIFSGSRKKLDKLAKTGRFHIIKNRFGADGMTFPVTFDADIGKIDMYDGDSVMGQKILNSNVSEDDLKKQRLAERYHQFKGISHAG